MSTNKRISAAARRRRQKVIMQRRIACLVVSTGLIAGTAFTSNHFHQKEVQALNDEICRLNVQVTELASENQDLSAALQKSNEKLRLFVYDTTVHAAEPTYYDIPLSKELQLYTYTRCVDYGIPEHYELVLAMMWQESNYTPDIVSATDDYGIMQINACNHEWLSDLLGTTNFLDVYQNIDAGTYIISKMLLKYGDEHKALMAYNMGCYGASKQWDRGNYSSYYSTSITSKADLIALNQYS